MQPETRPPIEVYDVESSRLLATGQEAGGAGNGPRTFCCLDGNGALLTYYFGRGKRQVMVRMGPNEGITARLGTRWNAGHREWTLD